MSTRSVLGLLYTTKAFKELGYPIDDLLQRYGLHTDTLDANARIDRATELEILCDICALNPDPLIGMSIGSQMGIAGYGPLSMLVMTCQNAYEACQMGVRYQALAYLFGDIKLHLGSEQSELSLEPMTIPAAINQFVILRDLAGTYRFVRDIFQMNDRPIKLSEVTLSFELKGQQAKVETLFQCPVRFSQQNNTLRLPSHYLKAPFPQGNTNAFDMYREQCDKLLLQASDLGGTLHHSLYRYLNMFNFDYPSVVEAANTFGMSERTFRRQLKREGYSYQKVLDQVRFDKAKTWLSESLVSIEQIANKLGYQEAAAFNHAFKRWSGRSPSQYRKQH